MVDPVTQCRKVIVDIYLSRCYMLISAHQHVGYAPERRTCGSSQRRCLVSALALQVGCRSAWPSFRPALLQQFCIAEDLCTSISHLYEADGGEHKGHCGSLTTSRQAIYHVVARTDFREYDRTLLFMFLHRGKAVLWGSHSDVACL